MIISVPPLPEQLVATVKAAMGPRDPRHSDITIEHESGLVIVTYSIDDRVIQASKHTWIVEEMANVVNAVYAIDPAVERLSVIVMSLIHYYRSDMHEELVARVIVPRATYEKSGGAISPTNLLSVADDPFIHPTIHIG